MSKGWSYSSGDWLLICDVCSKKIKASLSKHRWDGFIVCHDCYESRHQQDFVRAKMDKISVSFSRPSGQDIFITVDYVLSEGCSPTSRMCQADIGTADCATVGLSLGVP